MKIGSTKCLPFKVTKDNINYFPMTSFTSCLRKLKWVPDIVRILVGYGHLVNVVEKMLINTKNTLNLKKACNLWFINLKARLKA